MKNKTVNSIFVMLNVVVALIISQQLFAQENNEQTENLANEIDVCLYDIDLSNYAHAYLTNTEPTDSNITASEATEVNRVLDENKDLSNSDRFAKVLEACNKRQILRTRY